MFNNLNFYLELLLVSMIDGHFECTMYGHFNLVLDKLSVNPNLLMSPRQMVGQMFAVSMYELPFIQNPIVAT